MRLTRIAERPLSVFLILVISLSFGLPRIIPAASSPTAVSDPVSAVRAQIQSMESSLDSSRAMSMAMASAQFQSSIQALNFTFNSIFNTWTYSFGPNGLAVVWKDVNVVYTHQFANGTYENIVVTEDPHLTQILGVNTQRNVPSQGHVAPVTTLATTTASLSPSTSPASPFRLASPAVRGASPALITQSSPTSPDFSLSSSAPSLTVVAGNSANALMTLTSVNGFVGSIALEYSVTPANTQNPPSVGLSVNSITLLSSASGTSNLSVVTTPFPNTNTGTYNVNVTAVSGTLVHSVFVTVNIQASIQLTVGAPSPSSFIAGGSATSSISVTSVGVTGSVSFSALVSPQVSNTPTTNFSPGSVSITPGSQAGSTLSITTTSSTQSNTYTVTVYANGPGGMNVNAQISVVVQPDFQISATTPVYVGNGQSGSSAINLQSYGFAGSVSLQASSSSGITTSFDTNPVSLSLGGSGVSHMTINVPSSVSTGDYTISLTGSSGSISHTTSIDVSVCHSSSGNSINVAGYLFSLNCSGNRLVLGAKSSWTVPSVNEPSSYHCYNQDCDVTVSSALTDGSGSSSGAVFAGSFSDQHCGLAGCDSPSYHLFYDYLPNNSVLCSNSVNSGDSITGEVTNNYFNPNLAGTQYFATITDVTKGTSCSVLQTSSMGSPYYAQFSAARPNTRLPQFSTVTITSCQLGFPGQYSSCAYAYSQGFYTVYTMVNSGTTNVAVSSVGSDSSFTLTWKSSNGA